MWYSGGLIVNQVAAGTAASAHPANTGNGTLGGLSTAAGSKFGTYTLTAKTATDFGVVDPDGDVLPDATVGTAYVGPVDFTLAAGGNAFVAGDSFTIAVSQQTGGWVSWTGGAINRIGILFNRCVVAAGGYRNVTIVVRECEVNQAEAAMGSGCHRQRQCGGAASHGARGAERGGDHPPLNLLFHHLFHHPAA